MSNASVGLLAGLLLSLAAVTGGLLGILLALVLGGIGLAVGAHYDGSFDLSTVLRGRNRG